MRVGVRRGVLLALPLALTLACGEDEAVTLDAGPVEPEAPPVWVVEPGIPTSQDLFAVWGRGLEDVYAVGWGGTVLHYDGTAWRVEVTTSTQPLTAIHGRPFEPDALPTDPTPPTVAVGWNGTVLERAQDGTWGPAPSTSTSTEDLFGVSLGADDSGLAVGDRGRILGWDGAAWSLVPFTVPGEFSGLPIAPKGVLKGVWSGNGQRYYITGSGGATYRSAGGYDRFEALDSRVNDPLRGVWGTANNDVYTVGLDTLILHFTGRWRRQTDDGADTLPSAFLFGIWGTSSADITAVGWGGTAVRRLDGQWSVEKTGTETDLRGVWVDPQSGVAFAVGASGTVLRRTPVLEDDAGVP